MGAAAYIGRVGGLAVALGVGTAIATGYGVASADDTASNPPSFDTSTTSGATDTKTNTATTTGTTTTTNTQTSTEPSTTPSSSEPDKGTTSSGTTTNTVTGGVVVSAQTNTGTFSTTGTTEPTHEAEPTAEPSQTPTPTETAAPQPTQTTEPEEHTKSQEAEEVSTPPSASKSSNESGAALSVAKPSAKASAPTVKPFADPATNIQQPDKVAVFADARGLAATGPTNVSPVMAAQVTGSPVAPAPASSPDPVTAVANVVSNVINWVLNPLVGTSPTTPAQPPLIWGLLAFARREFENFFNALSGRSAESVAAPPQTTSLALDNTEMASFAAAAAAVTADPPYLPFPSAQVSPSTQFVSWVTGGYNYGDPTLANTLSRYSIYGTDLGIMWDNGIPDDPATLDINEHQVLIAVGDTFGGPNSADWRANTILRSSDTDLSNGITIPDGQWYTGNWFGGAPLGPDGYPNRARQVIFPSGLPAGVGLIPTAGISIPTPGTEFGVTQYMSFMSVTQWGAPGQWATNYSALAYSADNGENWTVAPQSVRYNQPWSGNQNFQQSAFVRPGDGYVYVYGTPNGRQGAAYVSRVAEKYILDLSKYDYYSAGPLGGWYQNDPSKATPVFGQDTGACGVANPGNQVSEMSVQYNNSLKKYVVLYGDQFNNIVMRTSDTPQGTWSSAKVLMAQQNGGIYAPMMHPWSPSTQGTGTDLYWNLSLWNSYNVMLMRTDLSKV